MRWICLCLALIIIPSCREVNPLETLTPIHGYQLNGIVTTKDGLPIDSVVVSLQYHFSVYQYTPLDTVQVFLADSTRRMFVGVFTPDDRRVRTLFDDRFPAGLFPNYYWDEKDDSGQYVPSGKYFVKYINDTAIVKIVPWLADAHQTTMTNIAGQFSLTSSSLPLGELFDLYYYDSSYDATYRVMTGIRLFFNRGQLRGMSEVSMEKDKITRGSFIVE